MQLKSAFIHMSKRQRDQKSSETAEQDSPALKRRKISTQKNNNSKNRNDHGKRNTANKRGQNTERKSEQKDSDDSEDSESSEVDYHKDRNRNRNVKTKVRTKSQRRVWRRTTNKKDFKPQRATAKRFSKEASLTVPTQKRGRGRPSKAARRQKTKACNQVRHGKVVGVPKWKKYKILLPNRRGREYTENERKIIVKLIAGVSATQRLELDKAIDQVVDWIGGSHRTFANIWNEFDEFRNIEPDSFKRGSQNDKMWLFTNEMLREVVDLIGTATIANHTGITAADLQFHFEENYDMEFDLKTMRDLLKFLKCDWEKSDIYYGTDLHPAVLEEKKKALLQYSHALQLQAKQKYIIVYQDETWINQWTCTESTWKHRSCSDWKECWICQRLREIGNKAAARPKRKGPRFIISHCITDQGMLNGKVDGEVVRRLEKVPTAQFDWKQKIESAELIFQCQSTKTKGKDGKKKRTTKKDKPNVGDYHTQMNADTYCDYIVNRVIPAFENLFPEHTMVLFVDNASTHASRDEYPELGATKKELIDYMKSKGLQTFYSKRKAVKRRKAGKWLFRSSSWSTPAPKGPLREELVYACYKALNARKKDEVFLNNVTKRIRLAGHEVVWNSKYTPENQPMELWNAYVKQFAKKKQHSERKMDELYEDIQDGMYGGTYRTTQRKHKGVDKHLCRKFIGHCHKFMNQTIKEFEWAPEGTTIEDFWTESSPYSVGQPDYFCPLTPNFREKHDKEFRICGWTFEGDTETEYASSDSDFESESDAENSANKNQVRQAPDSKSEIDEEEVQEQSEIHSADETVTNTTEDATKQASETVPKRRSARLANKV